MCTISSVKIETGWLCQVIRCCIGGMGMKVQYASPWTTPTYIVIMTNAARNMAVWVPATPRLLVIIFAMSISFLNWPQVGGSLSRVCLACSHFLGYPLVNGWVSLRSSLSWGESSSLSLLIFRTRGSMRLDKPWWYPHWVFCTFRKNTSIPLTPNQGRTRSLPFARQDIFPKNLMPASQFLQLPMPFSRC
jgi:hypothetical protein